jgi:hypothetical protein
MQYFHSLGLKLFNKVVFYLYRHVILILTLFLGLGLAIAISGTHYLFLDLIESQALQHAQVFVETLNIARKHYSKNVVDRAKGVEGIQVNAEYTSMGGHSQPCYFYDRTGPTTQC